MADKNQVVRSLQWYQSGSIVTVCLKVDEKYRNDVEALFEVDYCTLQVAGEDK